MKKFFYTALVGLLVMGQIEAKDLPFIKVRDASKVKASLEKHRMSILPANISESQMRVSNVTPDSITFYDYDGSAWEIAFTGKLAFNGNAQVTGMTLYAPPPFSLPIGQFSVTYNASGKLTSMQQSMTFPTPSVVFRVEQRYDANNNVSSVKYFEDNNGSLEMTSGDSVVYTYSGGEMTTSETSFYDQMTSTWRKGQRLSGLQFNSNGHATAVTFQYWDDMAVAWSTENMKYANIEWGLGYPGNDYLIGIGTVSASDFLSFVAAPDYRSIASPTNYIEWVQDGSMVDTLSRTSSTVVSGRVTQTLSEEFMMGSWMPSNRRNYDYDAAGRIVLATEQIYNSLAWEDDYRYLWAFDAQNNLIKEEESYHDGSAFVIGYGQEYEYLYTANNIPFQMISKYYDGSAYVFSEKTVYNFGSFNTSVTELNSQKLSVYPNPVKERLNIQFESNLTTEGMIQITSVNGQLIHVEKMQVMPGANAMSISMESFESGIYFLKVFTGAGIEVVKLVK